MICMKAAEHDGFVTENAFNELRFKTIDEVRIALERANINPFLQKAELDRLAAGHPVAFVATDLQVSAFYS
jgi:hypothetical protein